MGLKAERLRAKRTLACSHDPGHRMSFAIATVHGRRGVDHLVILAYSICLGPDVFSSIRGCYRVCVAEDFSCSCAKAQRCLDSHFHGI